MEGKSAYETRNKRKLQSDVESRRRRHKGGMQINHHPKNDADVRMETIIYKLDSSNKIVLPLAHETNTDRDFLKYVKTYLEQASLSDNLGGRSSILDKSKVKHERARNSKRLSYESDTTIEEQTMPKTARHRRRSSGRHTRNDEDVDADVDAMTYIYEKRPRKSVNRNAKICSCQPRLHYNMDGSFIVPNEAAFTRVASVARDNERTACELSEEQMLRCFQLVFKQLCTLNNVNGTILNIDVATPTESPLRSIHNPTSYVENTARNSYTPSPPEIYTHPPPQEIAPLPATTENYMVPEAALEASIQPLAVTHQEFQPRQQSQVETLTQSLSGKKMSQEQFFYPSHKKSTFTEPVETQVLGKQFDINNEPLPPLPLPNRTGIYNDDPTKLQSFPAAQQANEMQQQHSQQHNNQQTLAGQMNQHYYASPEQHQQQQQQQQHHQQQQLQQLHQQQQQQQLQPQQEYQRRRSSFRNSEARENYPTEFDWGSMIPLHRLSTARQSTATPTAAELQGGAGTGMNPQQQGAGRQTNVNYPMYPLGQRDGLQDVTADNVRVIPNIRVVDYSENGCGMPVCVAGDNESYEYILMRVKKKKLHCPCDH